MSVSKRLTRRRFLGHLGQGALGGIVASTVLPVRSARAARVGYDEKIRVGMIGTGNMGTQHAEALARNPQCMLVAVCDVFESRYRNAIEKIKAINGQTPDACQDFRRLLERKDIDAIWVATPDHWHPLATIMACKAGKDVYVEKPISPTVVEGRAMVQAARRYGRIVQVGTQQRSMPVFQKAVKLIREGKLGQVTSATAWVSVNGWSIGETPQSPPPGLDWDLWQGPAPWAPYSPQRHYGFMGWHDYARGGQLTNWGIHLMDIVHWGIGEDRPLSVQVLGGSYRGGAGADNFESIEALYEYKGCTVTWEQRHQNLYAGKGYGIKFQGTEGTLFIDRNSFIVTPNSLGVAEVIGKPEKSWAYPQHHDNFFNCVRTRRLPIADIEQGHRSTSAVLLAGIALKVKRKLNWDGEAETFIRDEAADRHLSRPYRAPWHL